MCLLTVLLLSLLIVIDFILRLDSLQNLHKESIRIDRALEFVTNDVMKAGGNRPDIPDVVILLTGGKQTQGK